jgi:GT2 family glycosyltransferase
VELRTSNTNLGFIEPNNELVGMGSGEYILLLNSDCEVFDGWWQSLIGFLQSHPDVAETGFMGGILGETGIGCDIGFGYDIDYLSGWGVAFSRKTYEEFGLFNKELQFAYGEDSDFSLRLKEAGKKIYAIYTPMAFHHGNITAKQVNKESLTQFINHNHEYLRRRWKDYLQNERIQINEKF